MNPWITWGPVSLLLIEFLVSICLLVVFTAWGRERAVRYYSASFGLAVGVLTLSLLQIAREGTGSMFIVTATALGSLGWLLLVLLGAHVRHLDAAHQEGPGLVLAERPDLQPSQA